MSLGGVGRGGFGVTDVMALRSQVLARSAALRQFSVSGRRSSEVPRFRSSPSCRP
jgi:hypothetical protein